LDERRPQPPADAVSTREEGMFRMLRYFSIAGLVAIVLAAVLLAAFYRHVAIQGIVRLGEEGNVALAQTALNSMRGPLVEYLAAAAGARGGRPPLPVTLDRAMQGIMRDTTVERITILNQRGQVVFSTKTEQVGRDERDNAGFAAAIRGNVLSKLRYHDGFNPFDAVTDDDNLIETYLPVRRAPTAPVFGVLEIYTDVTPLVAQTEHTQLVIMAGGAAILLLLYAALLAIVRRAERIIDGQQHTIRERTRALELVSARLLTAQENERRRIAGGLHEGLAQALSAIKLKFEGALQRVGRGRVGVDLRPLEEVLESLQGAIQEVRSLAMELRPPSLDELGLIDTLNWYFREFRDAHPGVALEAALEVAEGSLPEHLKTVVYRIVQEVFDYLVRQCQANALRVTLSEEREQITLILGDSGPPYRSDGPARRPDEAAIAAAKERALLSGGTFTVETAPWGATTVRASWPLLRSRRRSQA
jgi:signal transduction histidine kinase